MYRRQFMAGLAGSIATISTINRVWAQTLYPTDYDAIVEASKNEPKVLLYSTFAEDSWNPTKEVLKNKYPWIELQTLDLNGPELVERYRMEKASNAATADLFVFNGPGEWYGLWESGDLIDYQSPEIPNYPTPTPVRPGQYIIMVDADVFEWNKLLLPEPPASLEELVEMAKARPDFFRGRLTCHAATQQSSYYLNFRRLLDHHGEKLWNWIEVLAPLTRVERSSVTIFEKVLSGEYVLGYFIAPSAAKRALKRDQNLGEMFGWRFPNDGTTVGPRFGGIPAATRAPNSARLILDLLLSKEGQASIAFSGRPPYRPDMTQAEIGEGEFSYKMIVDEIGEKNALMIDYDPKLFEDYDEIIARWKSIYGM